MVRTSPGGEGVDGCTPLNLNVAHRPPTLLQNSRMILNLSGLAEDYVFSKQTDVVLIKEAGWHVWSFSLANFWVGISFEGLQGLRILQASIQKLAP